VEHATLDLAKVISLKLGKITQKQISDFKKEKLSSNTVKDILASLISFIHCGFPWIDGQHIFTIA
jgi:hypothetical protein